MLSVNYLPRIYKYRVQIKCFNAGDCIALLRFLGFVPLYCQVESHHRPWAADGGLVTHPGARGSLLLARACTQRGRIFGEGLATRMAVVCEGICVLCFLADQFLPF